MNVYFAIAANRVIVDSITNQVSIIDLFEHLKSSAFPVLVPKLTLLFYVSRDKGDPDTKDLSVVCKLNEAEIFYKESYLYKFIIHRIKLKNFFLIGIFPTIFSQFHLR